MFKRFSALFIILALALSFSGCVSTGAPKVDAPETASVSIGDYLQSVQTYFVPSNLKDAVIAIQADGLKGEEAFEAYVARWDAAADTQLPAALVDSYVNSFKASMGDDSAMPDDATLKAYAINLIKEEMVIYHAYKTTWPKAEITDAVRAKAAAAMAEETGFAKESFFTAGLDESAYYAVDTYIKKAVITSYLSGETSEYLNEAEDTSAEESASDAVTSEETSAE